MMTGIVDAFGNTTRLPTGGAEDPRTAGCAIGALLPYVAFSGEMYERNASAHSAAVADVLDIVTDLEHHDGEFEVKARDDQADHPDQW
ncbi:hypothetical protein GCM10009780_09720 [Actinomadura alba]